MSTEPSIQRFAYQIGMLSGLMNDEAVRIELQELYGKDIVLLEQAIRSIYQSMYRQE